MLSQEIIWTTLPYRVRDGHLLLSVLVSARLGDTTTPDLKLGDFADFLKWNDVVPELTFVVETDTGEKVEAKPDLALFDASIWPLLFTEETYVRSYNFTDLKDRRIRSYPMRQVLQYLKKAYVKLGEQSPSELPLFSPEEGMDTTLDQLRSDLGSLTDREFGSYDRKMDNLLSELKAIPPDPGVLENSFPSPATANFFQARRFYHRPEEAEPYLEAPDPTKLSPPPPVERPELDFHQALALLSDHPPLLRRLGIVLDLLIPIGDLPLKDQGLIRVIPQPGGNFPQIAAHQDRSPWTRYIFTGERFLPAPDQGSDLQDGFLRLEGVNDRLEVDDLERPYDLVQVDADGLAIKAVHFAGTLTRLFSRWDPPLTPIDEPRRTGPPSIQTGGLALVRAHRAYRLHQHLVRAAAKNSQLPTSDPEFSADELLRGFRVDVRDEADGQWRSLCVWEGAYEFSGAAVPPILFGEAPLAQVDQLEEGYVKSASASSQEDADPDLYFHETLLRWDGWSLVAPRPGRAIVRREDEVTGEVDEHTDVVRNTAATEFGVEINPQAKPGTLPRLRFGHTYQMRVRAVDLAGNSLPLSDPDDVLASDPVRFQRYEPLQPPTLAARARFAEGESLERMVIRSDFDRSAPEYAADPDVQAALAGEDHTYSAANERHVVPPKTSQVQAEQHGMFDPFFAPGLYQQGYNIALKEAGTLEDTAIVDINTGNKVSLPDPTSVEVVTPEAEPGEEPPKHYVLHKEATLLLPYLPDPIGRGAALRNLPGAAAAATPGLETIEDPGLELNVLRVPFDLQWPQALPFRLRLAERPGQVLNDDCTETLEHEADPPVWDAGTRELTVFLPKATTATVWYSTYPNEDAAGNSDLDLMGLWDWLKDSPKAKELEFRARAGAHWMVSPYRQLVLVHAVQRPLCAPRILEMGPLRKYGETFTTLTGKFELSVKSTGKLDMNARWDQPVDDVNKSGPDVISGAGHAFEWPIETDFKDSLEATEKTGLRHEFGDTLHRLVRYRLTGTTRFREYFHPSITGNPANITRTGPEFEVHVPASARPAAPEVEYLLPTFKWEEQQEIGDGEHWLTLQRLRRGNGLRVYLRRPWYSSGADEQLGVVLWPFPSWFPSERFRKYVSLIGMDPVHKSNPPQGVLTPEDFSNKVSDRSWLSLQEVPVNVFRVAAFAVAYNSDRQLWYADIQFDAERQTSYYPFVRLALARYQPHAITGAHLSPISLTDFMQLTPDRTLIARWIDDQSLYVQVRGYANINRADNRMEAVIETHDPGIPGELGWKALASVDPFPMRRNPVDLSHYLWKWEAVVTLPKPRGSQPMRLLVKEFERYADDSHDEKGERIVYADRFEL